MQWKWWKRKHSAGVTEANLAASRANSGASEGSLAFRERPTIVIAWDPDLVTEEEYITLVTSIGDLVRAEGGLGVHRLDSLTVGVRAQVLA